MHFFVSGGAGYIGSILAEQLIERGHTAVVFDNLYQGHREAVHPDATFVLGDLADRAAIAAAMKHGPFDAIFHFAAYTLVGESMEYPIRYLRDSVSNGLNLMEAAVDHGVPCFILSSTANLFDRPEHIPIGEDEAIIPGSPYGESKHMLERALYWLEKTHGLRYAAFRYFNACGASERFGEHHDPETHLIPLVLQVALGQRDHIKIFGTDYDTPDGTCIRDYIHVVDLADAHIRALAVIDESSRHYNLGNGRGYSVKEVIDTARNITGHPIPAIASPRRPGDPAMLIAASDRARAELGWTPRYPDLETIVSTAWRWHQAHPHGYAR